MRAARVRRPVSGARTEVAVFAFYDGTSPGDDKPVIAWHQRDRAAADIARPGQSCVAAH